MQLVINISSNHYEALKKMSNVGLGYYYEAILNGTPLPKRHGELIDRQALLHNPYNCSVNWYDEIKYAPTIVEESEEG